MKSFIKRFCNALKPCAGLVHTPKIKPLQPIYKLRARTHASASASLLTRGSIALSRFPVVTEEDMAIRKKKILDYDFESFK